MEPAPPKKKRDRARYREQAKKLKQLHGRRRRTFPLESQIKLNFWVRQHPDATDEEIRAWAKEAKLYTPRVSYKPIGRQTILIARQKAREARENSSTSQESNSGDDSQGSVAITNILSQPDSDKENQNSFEILSEEVFAENYKHTAHVLKPKPPCGNNHEPCNCFKWDEQKLEWVRRLITN